MSNRNPRRGMMKLERGRMVARRKMVADKKVVYVERVTKSRAGVKYTHYVPMLVNNPDKLVTKRK